MIKLESEAVSMRETAFGSLELNWQHFLKWHKVLRPQDAKVDERRFKWKAILESGTTAPPHEQWNDDKKAAMIKLESEAVSMRETAFGCQKEQHKQELFATFKAMPLEEKTTIHEGVEFS